MKLPTYRLHYSAGIRALLAVVLCCSVLPAAALLTADPTSVALTCNTITGPGPGATIVIKPVATLTTGTIAVTTPSISPGVVVTPPASATLNSTNQSQGLTYTLSAAPGCVGAVNGPGSIRFYAGGVADVTVPLTMSVSATASPLAATPVVLTCVRSAGPPVSYTPGPAQTASVISAAAGGTPFTVYTSGNPAWLSVTPASGGIADSNGVSLTVAAVAPCGNYAVGSTNSTSIHLKNLPAPDGLIPVTLQIVSPPPVTATPAAPSLSYVKGSGTPSSVTVALSAAGSATPAFTVDPTSLPAWLSLDAMSGAVPATLHFSTTSVTDSIASGAYSATVQVQIPGYANLAVPFHLTISDPPPTLTVAEGITRNLTWTIGQPLPIPYITLASSGAPIPYSIVTAGPLAPIIGSNFAKGLAYDFDTPIPVTFNPSVFAGAQAGSVVTGTVSITWGSPSTTTVVTINIAVQSATAMLLGVSPVVLPAAAPGQTFTVALSGTGFIAGADVTQRTVVGIVSGGSLASDPNIAATVVNASNIILTIAVPATADSALPFAPTGSGGTVTLGVCNPMGTGCTTPTGTVILTIGTNPLIQAATSASAFQQVTPPALPTVAPYDMISLFGINFCAAGGTGCGSGGILYGAPDPSSLRFPTALSPDPSGGTQRQLTVTFQTHAVSPVAVANAPLLFATNSQINLLVPSAVAAYVGKALDIVVNFASASSAPFSVNVAATDPGLFTVGADGQGDGAILAMDWTIVGQGNEAGMRQTAADSDTVQIYATGLGAPDSKADNTAPGKGLWPADCVSSASFLSSLDKLTSTSFTTLDGALMASAALNAGRLVPCLSSAATTPKVTVGGQPGVVTYAGWVPDSVAGQYQVNVRLPGSSAGPFTTVSGAVVPSPLMAAVQLPVVITVGGRTSQAGVTIWVAPQLKVTGPGSAGLRGTAGTAWPATANVVTATEGTAPYQFAVTAGSLPAGLTLNPATGVISGTPTPDAAGSYTLTVTATDSAAMPLTGSATFTLTVAAAH